jgi:hypothetical protein
MSHRLEFAVSRRRSQSVAGSSRRGAIFLRTICACTLGSGQLPRSIGLRCAGRTAWKKVEWPWVDCFVALKEGSGNPVPREGKEVGNDYRPTSGADNAK